MRVIVSKVDGEEEVGILLYKDTLGVFIRVDKKSRFIPWGGIETIKTVRVQNTRI